MRRIHDVVISGCGPAGLAAALVIARYGRTVAIIDRHEDIYPLPRAIAFDHEVARILNMLGLTDVIAPHLSMPGVYQWRNQHNDLLFELDWAGTASVSGFAASYLFSQPQLERVLNTAARTNPLITMYRGVELDGFVQDNAGVVVSGQSTTGDRVTIAGQWLIGADGANSTVRRLMGGNMVDLGFEADWLVVDILPQPGAELPLDNDLMLQVCDPARPTTVVSGGPGRRRWEFIALSGETLQDLNSADRAWDLLKPWGVNPGNAILERHAVYTFKGAIADRWRVGRVFLAGDAAHLTPPFAGQGMCAGFRDAAALAWRLHCALGGYAGPALLDRYESERNDHAMAWIFNAIELGNVICVLDPAAAAERDIGMMAARKAGMAPPSSGILPPIGPGLHLADQHGGTLAVGGKVHAGGRTGHFDDIVGCGFVLLTRTADPGLALSPENAAFWRDLGGIVVGFGTGAPLDTEGTYGRWFAELDADAVLIRPDFYVFAATRGTDAANDLVTALAARV